MSPDQLLILPEEVLLIPMQELSEQVKDKFTFEEDDFILTYTHTRNTSKVVNPASVSLLKEFRTPKSLVEGIYKYSILNNLDPHQTLEESYMFLSRLKGEGFLVPYNETAHHQKEDLLKKDEVLGEYTVVGKIMSISDTEVYKIQKNSRFFALKILKPTTQTAYLTDSFNNEVEVLQHLEGIVAPLLIEQGEYNGNPYMIIEWCAGLSCEENAEKYRNFNDARNLAKMLQTMYAIIKSYEHLHTQHVIHSDVHPRNIIITDQGQVKIIDFGLSKLESSARQVHRGGMGFFYEPEFAEASMLGRNQPATYAGEQYAVAALLYFLIIGKHYLNFSLESDTLFKQIATESPISFSNFDIALPAGIEAVIFKALSKKPEDRFTSMSAFAACWLEATRTVSQQAASIIELTYSFSAFCNSLKNKYGLNSNLIDNGLMLAPTCSVNYGAAGIAYMLYRMACIENDAELLSVADIWANRAAAYVMDERKAFYSADIEITPETVGTISIYHTASGVHLVQALISQALGDYVTSYNSIIRFIEAAGKPCENLDLTLGKSSTLIGCCLLYENATSGNATLLTELTNFGNITMDAIWEKAAAFPPISDKNPINYRGIAHGWAGIIYATLKWCDQAKTAIPENVYDRVDQLVALALKENNYTRWALTNTEAISWPGWCHGSAGYTFLWTLLHQITKDEKFLELAESTTRHFLLTDKNNNNGSLCCGMGGEAYALLNVYKINDKNFYLKEAKALAKKMLLNIGNPAMKNNSLYKGEVGAGVLFSELASAKHSLMPLFE